MDPSLPWEAQEFIPHSNITDEIFDKYEDFFAKPSKSITDTNNRILASPFLTSLLERRPSDATFNDPFVRFLSPMVRYSKLPFRVLCRRYGADLAFTPMILAKDVNRGGYITQQQPAAFTTYDEYSHSSEVLAPLSVGREDAGAAPEVWRFTGGCEGPLNTEEFTTSPEDRPLIAQLAANDPIEAGKCAEVFAQFVDGIDINCGCPQGWVLKEGIGAALSKQPQLVQEIVREVRKRTHGTVSVKIRVRNNLQETVELLRRAEHMGVEWVTVHGRTRSEKTQAPVRTRAIEFLQRAARVSVIYNGDVNTPEDMRAAVAQTGADGVLCARGALANPALFCGRAFVPDVCLADYMVLAAQYGGLFAMHQHHLAYMQYGAVSKADRAYFTRARSMPALADYLASKHLAWDLAAPLAERWAPLYSPSEQARPLHLYPAALHDVPPYSHIERLEAFDGPLPEAPSRPGCSHLYSWSAEQDVAAPTYSPNVDAEHLPLRVPHVTAGGSAKDGWRAPAGYGAAWGQGMAAFDCLHEVELE